MSKKRELPFSNDYMNDEFGGRTTSLARPWSPLQALMECAPGQEPDVSRSELLELRESIADAIDGLEPMERFVFNTLIVERRSVRYLEPYLAKTTACRVRDNAIGKLREALQDHPAVLGHLTDTHTTEDTTT